MEYGTPACTALHTLLCRVKWGFPVCNGRRAGGQRWVQKLGRKSGVLTAGVSRRSLSP